jgi:hypothetical protein
MSLVPLSARVKTRWAGEFEAYSVQNTSLANGQEGVVSAMATDENQATCRQGSPLLSSRRWRLLRGWNSD